MHAFLHPTLTRIHGRPTPHDIQRLKQELIANAMSIPSAQGAYGHVALVLSDDELLAMNDDTPFVIPQHPGEPPHHAANASYAEVHNAERKYDYQVEQFNTYIYTRNCLCSQIIAAVDGIYLDALCDPVVGFGDITPRDFLQHLVTNYGTITLQDLQTNRNQLKKPWNPNNDHIDTLRARIKSCQDFAFHSEDPISNYTAMMFTLDALADSGVMDQYISQWHRLDCSEQTLPNFFKHFERANQARLDCQQIQCMHQLRR